MYLTNKLLKVSDAIKGFPDEGFKDGTNTGNDFTYDPNGNMLTDANKGITNIVYNHLNLPVEIVFENNPNKKINYFYTADSLKVKKVVNNNGNITTTEYNGNHVYENGVLKQITHKEGYLEPKAGGGYQYVYRIADIWGNTRITFADDDANGIVTNAEIRREQNYYPFGLKHKGYNNAQNGRDHKYEYNGQETETSLGLNVTEMDFRQYDPVLGRFNVPDAWADIIPTFTPYRFGFNNPIKWKDPKGLMESDSILPVVLKEVEVSATWKPKMQSSEATQDTPTIWTSSFNGDLAAWNRQMGTNFTDERTAFQWWANKFVIQPRLEREKKELIAAIHSGTSKAAKIIMIAGGTAAAAPYVFASPVLSAAFWRAATDAGTQALFNEGKVDLFDASLSAIIPAGGSKLLQGFKFAGQTTIDFTITEQDFNNIFDGSKSFSDFAVDSFTGAFGQLYSTPRPNSYLSNEGFGNMATGFANLMNTMLKDEIRGQ